MECQPRDGPPQQSPNDPIAGAATFFPVITIISSGEHGDDPMAIYVVLKEHVKSFFFPSRNNGRYLHPIDSTFLELI